MSEISNRQRWRFGKDVIDFSEYNLSDLVQYYTGLMFNRTLKMFEWKNLPDGMTSFDMEKFTQLRGKTIFLKDKADGNRFYVLDGSPYNDISWNYEPTKAIVVNPSLNGLKNEYTLGKDCILIRNDYLMMGLYPIFEKNSIDLANTDISIRFANFNTRFKAIFSSDDDNDKASIDKLMKDVWDGNKPYAVKTSHLWKQKELDVNPYTTGQNTDIKDLMELKQYQLAQFFIELCLNANYNMKRENIGKSEATLMNEDVILPLIDQMLDCRKMAVDEINKMYGLEIRVELSSAWNKIKDEVRMDLAKQEADVRVQKATAEATEKATEENPTDNPDNSKEEKKEGDNDAKETE